MPSLQAHLDASEENIGAFCAMPDEYPGWQAVILFYAALHLMESLFADAGVHHKEHYVRDNHIRDNHKAAWPAYMRLKNESLKGRYLTEHRGQVGSGKLTRTTFSMTAPQVREQLYKKQLATIWHYVDQGLPASQEMPALAGS